MNAVGVEHLAADLLARAKDHLGARPFVDRRLGFAAQGNTGVIRRPAHQAALTAANLELGEAAHGTWIVLARIALHGRHHHQVGTVRGNIRNGKGKLRSAGVLRRDRQRAGALPHRNVAVNSRCQVRLHKQVGRCRSQVYGGALRMSQPAELFVGAAAEFIPNADVMIGLLGGCEGITYHRVGELCRGESQAVPREGNVGRGLRARLARHRFGPFVIDVVEHRRPGIGLPEVVTVQSARPIVEVPVVPVGPSFAFDAVEQTPGALRTDAARPQGAVGLDNDVVPQSVAELAGELDNADAVVVHAVEHAAVQLAVAVGVAVGLVEHHVKLEAVEGGQLSAGSKPCCQVVHQQVGTVVSLGVLGTVGGVVVKPQQVAGLSPGTFRDVGGGARLTGDELQRLQARSRLAHRRQRACSGPKRCSRYG